MAEGVTGSLLLTAAVAGGSCLWFVSRRLPLILALGVTVIKILLPLLYFAYFYDRKWNFLDDLSYQVMGSYLLQSGYDPVTIFFSADGLALLGTLAQGQHVLYIWVNHLMQYLFGPYYYPPVFFNVVLTCIAGNSLYSICRLCGFSHRYAQGLLLFFLLHWDILSWSSVLNLKDILAMTLAVAALHNLLRIVTAKERQERNGGNLIRLAFVFFLMVWIRFYLPALLLGVFLLWVVFTLKDRRKYLLLLVGAVFLLFVPKTGRVGAEGSFTTNPASILFGFVRFNLTPQPWSIEPEYSFSTIPAILHWLFFVPALVGAYGLAKRSPTARLLLLYLLAASAFYSVVDYLQGSRQRLQLAFVWVWMQYHFLNLAAQWLVDQARQGRDPTPALPFVRGDRGETPPRPSPS